MKNKFIRILVVMLLIASVAFPMVNSINTRQCKQLLDTVDQKQEQTPQLEWLDGEDWQQFQHGGGTLTKVDVHIGQYYSGSKPMTLSIETSVGATPMTLATLGPSAMPSNQQGWVSFDVIDVELIGGVKYYIVIRFDPGSEYAWSGAAMDPYPAGISCIGSNWDFAFRTYVSTANNPPNKPDTPAGQTNGNSGTSYTYSTSTDDPDGDQVWYKWDWGDSVSSWDGPYDSGDPVTKSHTWSNQGTFSVKVKAKDTNNDESVWSDPLSVTMPKNKAIQPPLIGFLENLVQNHPYMFSMLRLLLNLSIIQ